MNQRTFESLPLAVLPAWSHDDSGAPKARDRTLERPALRNVRPLGFGEHQRAPAGSMLAVSSSSPRLERTVDVVLRPAPGCPARCDRQTFTCHARSSTEPETVMPSSRVSSRFAQRSSPWREVPSPDVSFLVSGHRPSRERAGLTQVQLARKIGETQTFVSKCERGERRVDVVELRTFCKASGSNLKLFVAALEKALDERAGKGREK